MIPFAQLLNPLQFQSTLPHGERPRATEIRFRLSLFQSTLPHGDRPSLDAEVMKGPRVSIHAPAWGATPQTPHVTAGIRGFNRRSRMGSDYYPSADSPQCQGFNPRSRMGSHLFSGGVRYLFQSTLPHEERQYNPFFLPPLHVSIHAPAWGATGLHDRQPQLGNVSIHAPAWGARQQV